MKPRTIFFGTPEIAVPALRALAQTSEVIAVVCQPDRPADRNLSLRPPAVKIAAQELGLSVHQPSKVRTPEFSQWVRDQRADIGVVLAYGRILIKDVLEGPRLGCVNLHASLLPRYRGAAPINWAIVRGETQTGISLMQMDEGLDTGAVYCQRTLPIFEDERADELTERMALLAAEVLRNDLPPVLEGKVAATPQDSALVTEAPLLTKEHGRIDWSKPAHDVHNHIRGLQPWPGAFTNLRGKIFKILQSRNVPVAIEDTSSPGVVVRADKNAIWIGCGAGTAIELIRGQLEGRKALEAGALVSGRAIAPGERLG